MAILIDNATACADPVAVSAVCEAANPPMPTDWFGRANMFRVPLGREPGSGSVLLRDFDLSDLDQTIDHTLAFLDDQGNRRTLQKITFLKSQCLTPGGPDNDNSHFLCDVVDRRWHLARIPVDKAYNVAAVDGLSYLAGTLNGAAAWTWQQIVSDLVAILGIPGTPTLPFTPTGAPENLIFWAGMAWAALNDVLDRIACVIKYDVEADTFAILRKGDATAAAAIAAANLASSLSGQQLKLWDAYWNEPARGRLPEKVRVTFIRRPQPTDGTSIYYTVDVTLPATPGVVAGSFEQLHDDLTAVGAGVPANAASLATRAAERASDWLRNRLYAENRTTLVYRDFQAGMAFLAETTGAMAYDDCGGPMATELVSGPDGAMERFRAYEQPFVLLSTGRVPFVAALTEVTAPDSWQARTLVAGAWANDTPTGTNDAYPVQIGGADFTPLNGTSTIMWEEPPGSGIYAFLPIQFADATHSGFVSAATQTFAGLKHFASGITVDAAGVITLSGGSPAVGGLQITSTVGHGCVSVSGPDGVFTGIDAVITVGANTLTFKGGILISTF